MPSLSRPISPQVNTCEGSGYITAPILVSSQQKSGIEVIGPGRPDVKWQANTEQGIEVSRFRLDWEQQQATCPQGHTSSSWTSVIDHRKNEVIKIKFSTTDCGSCPLLARCTRSETKYQRVRAFGMRRSRYIGLARTHLQHLGIAAGMNVVRALAWLDGDELAPTRVSAFQRLYLAA